MLNSILRRERVFSQYDLTLTAENPHNLTLAVTLTVTLITLTVESPYNLTVTVTLTVTLQAMTVYIDLYVTICPHT